MIESTTGFFIFIRICIFTLVFSIFFWRIFHKSGKPGWGAIIPIYNLYLLLRTSGRPWWWIFLFLVPYINIVIFYIVILDIGKSFQRKTGFRIGLFLLPFIFLPVLAFDKSEYIGPRTIAIRLHWQILIALYLAVIYGFMFTEYVSYVAWMGDLFLRALKMIIVPLILTSIISGVVNIGDAHNLGRLGLKTFTYYISTSFFAILTGLILVNIIQPGVGADLGLRSEVPELAASSGDLGEIILRMVPTNFFDALASADMLAIIFFSILIGFFITRVSEKHKLMFTDFFNGSFEVMMKLTNFVIKFTPLGILGIVAAVVAEQADNLMNLVGRLGMYMSAVILGLVFHAFVTLPLILRFIAKVNPWLHGRAMSAPLLTAFSTSSSSATLPLTLHAVENNSGVSNKITSFVLPLGATVNMDGTALYECVAAMFIAQAYGIELGFLMQMVVVVTALLASIGAAGIPMAGLVMISVILSAVGLPLEGVGLILAVDRFLDMCRTTVNVWSDSCGAVTIAKTEGETLKV